MKLSFITILITFWCAVSSAQIQIKGILLQDRSVPSFLQSEGSFVDFPMLQEDNLHVFLLDELKSEGFKSYVISQFEQMLETSYVGFIYRYQGADYAYLPRLYIKASSVTIRKIKKELGRKLRRIQPVVYMAGVYELDLKLSNENSLLNLKSQFARMDGIDYISIDQMYSVQPHTIDPLYSLQWALDNPNGVNGNDPFIDISAENAWTWATGVNTKVAILDSGVDTAHPDLQDNMLKGYDALIPPSVFFGGYLGGNADMNFIQNDHGTNCAGIIAANADNSIGLAGLAYESKIIPVRVYTYTDFGGGFPVALYTITSRIVRGLNWATYVAEADVISNSYGVKDSLVQILDTAFGNDAVRRVFQYGRQGKGTSIVFSSGNNDQNYIGWLASLKETIAVGASNYCDERVTLGDCAGSVWGSNYGENLDLVAPGVNITTTKHSDISSFGFDSLFMGTSASAPYVSATIALMIEEKPGLTANQLKQCLLESTDKVGGSYDSTKMYGDWSLEMGYGRLNAFQAVRCAQFTEPDTASYNEPLEHRIKQYIDANFKSTLQVTVEKESSIQVELFNAIGQLIYTKTIYVLPGHYYFKLYEQTPTAGMYITRAMVNNELFIKKFWSPGD